MHNKISLIGYVGQQPDIRTVGDLKVASLSLGVTERGYTTKNGTKIEDKTTWFRIGAWKGLADICEKYVNKGDRIFVEGKMTCREYDSNGVRNIVWEVMASEIELLSSKKDGVENTGNTAAHSNQSQASHDKKYDLPF